MLSEESRLLSLIQFCDSALPVGGFSFSQTIESAATCGVVHDAESLCEYAKAIVRQSLNTDFVAAKHVLHNFSLSEAWLADGELTACKVAEEQRRISCRMGRSLAELSKVLMPEDETLRRWVELIQRGEVAGNYAISQALLFGANGLNERELFVAQYYGALSIALNAALRCTRLSHLSTQKILHSLKASATELYHSVAKLTLQEMHSFAPQIDILSSVHQKGASRMFMN